MHALKSLAAGNPIVATPFRSVTSSATHLLNFSAMKNQYRNLQNMPSRSGSRRSERLLSTNALHCFLQSSGARCLKLSCSRNFQRLSGTIQRRLFQLYRHHGGTPYAFARTRTLLLLCVIANETLAMIRFVLCVAFPFLYGDMLQALTIQLSDGNTVMLRFLSEALLSFLAANHMQVRVVMCSCVMCADLM